MKKQLATENSL